MSFKFTLTLPTAEEPDKVSPAIARRSAAPAEPTLAQYKSNNAPLSIADTAGVAYSRPGYWSSRRGIPQPDPDYSETDGSNPITGFLGEDEPSFFTTKAAYIYSKMNNGYLWSSTSFTIALLLVLGPGLRFAFYATAALITIVGLVLDPMLVAEFSLTRYDDFGDMLTRTTWALWTASAVLFAASRIVYRRDGFPWKQAPVLPDMLFNDRLPDSRDPDHDMLVWFLFAYAALGVLFVFVAMHTIIGQLYVARSGWYAILLLMLAGYDLVAALGDIARCGSPFGLPRGWCRWLRTFRALVVVPATFIFSCWVVWVSDRTI